MKNVIMGLCIVLLTACSSTGETVNAYRLSAADKAENKKENRLDMICTYTSPIGSKIKKRHCMTREQKERQKEISKRLVHQVKIRSSCKEEQGCNGW